MLLGFKGMLISTSDIQYVQAAAIDPNTKIMFMGDPEGQQQLIQNLRLILATPWIPDYLVMEADINGDPNEFAAKYIDYLNREESQMMFATLCTALYRGKNIILYFPPESMEFKYPTFLTQNYMVYNFGIRAATAQSPFNFDSRYGDKVAYLMYFYNTITPIEFILMTESMDINSLTKVIVDMRIPVTGDISKNPKPILDWIEEYKQRMLAAERELQKPFMAEVRC